MTRAHLKSFLPFLIIITIFTIAAYAQEECPPACTEGQQIPDSAYDDPNFYEKTDPSLWDFSKVQWDKVPASKVNEVPWASLTADQVQKVPPDKIAQVSATNIGIIAKDLLPNQVAALSIDQVIGAPNTLYDIKDLADLSTTVFSGALQSTFGVDILREGATKITVLQDGTIRGSFATFNLNQYPQNRYGIVVRQKVIEITPKEDILSGENLVSKKGDKVSIAGGQDVTNDKGILNINEGGVATTVTGFAVGSLKFADGSTASFTNRAGTLELSQSRFVAQDAKVTYYFYELDGRFAAGFDKGKLTGATLSPDLGDGRQTGLLDGRKNAFVQTVGYDLNLFTNLDDFKKSSADKVFFGDGYFESKGFLLFRHNDLVVRSKFDQNAAFSFDERDGEKTKTTALGIINVEDRNSIYQGTHASSEMTKLGFGNKDDYYVNGANGAKIADITKKLSVSRGFFDSGALIGFSDSIKTTFSKDNAGKINVEVDANDQKRLAKLFAENPGAFAAFEKSMFVNFANGQGYFGMNQQGISRFESATGKAVNILNSIPIRTSIGENRISLLSKEEAIPTFALSSALEQGNLKGLKAADIAILKANPGLKTFLSDSAGLSLERLESALSNPGSAESQQYFTSMQQSAELRTRALNNQKRINQEVERFKAAGVIRQDGTVDYEKLSDSDRSLFLSLRSTGLLAQKQLLQSKSTSLGVNGKNTNSVESDTKIVDAQINAYEGRLSQALNDVDQALKKDPNNPAAQKVKAEVEVAALHAINTRLQQSSAEATAILEKFVGEDAEKRGFLRNFAFGGLGSAIIGANEYVGVTRLGETASLEQQRLIKQSVGTAMIAQLRQKGISNDEIRRLPVADDEEIARLYNLPADSTAITLLRSNINEALNNPDVKNIIESQGKRLQFEDGQGYADTSYLKTAEWVKYGDIISAANVALIAGPLATVKGVQVVDWVGKGLAAVPSIPKVGRIAQSVEAFTLERVPLSSVAIPLAAGVETQFAVGTVNPFAGDIAGSLTPAGTGAKAATKVWNTLRSNIVEEAARRYGDDVSRVVEQRLLAKNIDELTAQGLRGDLIASGIPEQRVDDLFKTSAVNAHREFIERNAQYAYRGDPTPMVTEKAASRELVALRSEAAAGKDVVDELGERELREIVAENRNALEGSEAIVYGESHTVKISSDNEIQLFSRKDPTAPPIVIRNSDGLNGFQFRNTPLETLRLQKIDERNGITQLLDRRRIARDGTARPQSTFAKGADALSEVPQPRTPESIREKRVGITNLKTTTDNELAAVKSSIDSLAAGPVTPEAAATLDSIAQDAESSLTRIHNAYKDLDLASQLGTEKAMNELIDKRSTTVSIVSLDLTTANKLDTSYDLGDKLIDDSIDLLRAKFPAENTVTRSGTRIKIVGPSEAEVRAAMGELEARVVGRLKDSEGRFINKNNKVIDLTNFKTKTYAGFDNLVITETIPRTTEGAERAGEIVTNSIKRASGRAEFLEKAYSKTPEGTGVRVFSGEISDSYFGKGYIPEFSWKDKKLPRINHDIGLDETKLNALKSAVNTLKGRGAITESDLQALRTFEREFSTAVLARREQAIRDIRYPNSIKEFYFPQEVDKIVQEKGPQLMTHLEIDGFNAFQKTYAPDDLDSVYHQIIDQVHETAARHDIEITAFTKKGDEFFFTNPKTTKSGRAITKDEYRNFLEDINKDIRDLKVIDPELQARVPLGSQSFHSTAKVRIPGTDPAQYERIPEWVLLDEFGEPQRNSFGDIIIKPFKLNDPARPFNTRPYETELRFTGKFKGFRGDDIRSADDAALGIKTLGDAVSNQKEVRKGLISEQIDFTVKRDLSNAKNARDFEADHQRGPPLGQYVIEENEEIIKQRLIEDFGGESRIPPIHVTKWDSALQVRDSGRFKAGFFSAQGQTPFIGTQGGYAMLRIRPDRLDEYLRGASAPTGQGITFGREIPAEYLLLFDYDSGKWVPLNEFGKVKAEVG